jgi:SAM-dependent methyltransferase
VSSITPNLRQTLAITIQRTLWRRRAQRWDEQGSVGLSEVLDAVLANCPVSSDAVVLDLGCGSGQVTLPLARDAARVLAVDVSAEAIEMLEERARRDRLFNIEGLARPIETLELEAGSVDLVVSNYALHHLRDVDKRDVVGRAYHWLRPGGRLVVGDMMFGRGWNRRDREIIGSKVRALAARGPGGWWRILKNVGRFALRFQEKPLSANAWETIAERAGFPDVTITPVVAEACVMSALKVPDHPIAAAGARCAELLPEWVQLDNRGDRSLGDGEPRPELVDRARRAAQTSPTVALLLESGRA